MRVRELEVFSAISARGGPLGAIHTERVLHANCNICMS